MKRMLCGRALLAVAMLQVGPAAAQSVIDPDKLGAALAVPFLTDADTVTSAIVTNTGNEAIWLGIQWISGDPTDGWRSDSFSCVLTASETTQFVFRGVGNFAEVSFECSDPNAIPNSSTNDKSFQADELAAGSRGIMWLTVEDADGNTLSKNVLEGKAVVLNFAQGTAFALAAVPFQAPQPEQQDFDSEWRFDGMEYAAFPAALTTSFHAPDAADKVTAQLLLFTLDGTLSSGVGPRAQATLRFWNDDEVRRNGSISFDCFTLRPLTQLGSVTQTQLGSQVGHLELIPQRASARDLAHDQAHGDGNGSRVVPILGWLIQSVETGGKLQDAAGTDVSGAANGAMAWANLLTLSQSPLGTNNDVPTLAK